MTDAKEDELDMRKRINLVMRMRLCEKLAAILPYDGLRSKFQEEVNRSQSIGGTGTLGFDLSKILVYYDVPVKHLTRSSQSTALMKILYPDENNGYSTKSKLNMMLSDTRLLCPTDYNVLYSETPIGDMYLAPDEPDDESKDDDEDETKDKDQKVNTSWRGNDYDEMQGVSHSEHHSTGHLGISTTGMSRYTEPLFALGLSGFDSMHALFDPKIISALRCLHAGSGEEFVRMMKNFYSRRHKSDISTLEKALSAAQLYDHIESLTVSERCKKVNKFRWNNAMKKAYHKYEIHNAARQFLDFLLASMLNDSFLNDASDSKMQELESIFRMADIPGTTFQKYYRKFSQ